MADTVNFIEQLYYTWSTSGFGYGPPGYKVRAASESLADPNSQHVRELERDYCRYILPSGTNTLEAAKDAATIDKAPVCLIFSSHGRERILAYKVHRGRNEAGNYGNYFVHLLARLPESFVARDAIDLWRSNLWIKDEQNIGATRNLPQLSLSALAKSTSYFDEQVLSRAKDFMQTFLPPFMQAYLMTEGMQKIYIAGTSDQVALLIWGLTHCLPRTMQRDLTFSTYERERDILNTPLRIVGTCHPQTEILKGYIMPLQLIPQECYRTGQVIDCYSGTWSDLSFVSDEIKAYTDYATTCLLDGNILELNLYLKVAEEDGIEDSRQLLSFFKLNDPREEGKPLTEREITGIVTNKKSIAKNLSMPRVQQAIMRQAFLDPDWWEQKGRPALTGLRSGFNDEGLEKRDAALSSFGTRIATEFFAVKMQPKAKDIVVCKVNFPTKEEATKLLQSMLLAITPTAPPPKDSDIKPWDNYPWVRLLDSFEHFRRSHTNFHPNSLSWDGESGRSWFLQQWIFVYRIYEYEKRELQQQYVSRNAQEAVPELRNKPVREYMILPWLQLRDWNEFLDLLQLEYLPDRWCQIAFFQLLTYGKEPLPKEVLSLFNRPEYYALFTGALVYMVEQGQGVQRVLTCFDGLAQRNFRGQIDLLMTLLGAGNLHPKLVDDLFAAAQLNPRARVQLLEQYHQQLVPLESQAKAPKVVVEIIEEYLKNLTLSKLSEPAVVATLTHLDAQSAKFPAELAKNLHNWVVMSDIVNIPERVPRVLLVSDYLMSLANAIQYFKLQEENKYKVYLYFLLVANIKTRGDLVNVLMTLSPVLGGPEDFFRELTSYIGDKHVKQIPVEKFVLYVEEALMQAEALKNAAYKERFLVPLLRDLFNNQRKLFDYIDAEVSPQWPDPMRANWELFAGKIPTRKRSAQVLGAVSGMAKGAVEKQPRRPSQPSQEQPSSSTEVLPVQEDVLQQQPPSFSLIEEIVLPKRQRTAPIKATQPEPQSTVNGVPIHPEQVVRLYKLKTLYIRLRNDELEKIAEHARKHRLDIGWIIEEMEELWEFNTIEHALEALENNILISDALKLYSQQSISSDPVAFLNQIFGETFSAVKKQREYRQVLGNVYSDKDMQEVLYIFLRYRTLAAFFRNQGQNITMRVWLDKQRESATIKRSVMPLPVVD